MTIHNQMPDEGLAMPSAPATRASPEPASSLGHSASVRIAVLVCGGRDYGDAPHVYHALDTIHRSTPISIIIHGNARGADMLAHQWAKSRSVQLQVFPADWNKHGKAAGAIRNQQMLDEAKPDLVVAFPGGRGTADMVRRARKAAVTIRHEIAGVAQ